MTYTESVAALVERSAELNLKPAETHALRRALAKVHSNTETTLADDFVVFTELRVELSENDFDGLLSTPVRHLSLMVSADSRLYSVVAGASVGPRGGIKWTHASRYMAFGSKTKFYA